MRTVVYPRRVREGKMSHADAAHEVECMREILEILKKGEPSPQKELFS